MESEKNVFHLENNNEGMEARYEELLMSILKAKEEMRDIAKKLDMPLDREAMFADDILEEKAAA